MHIDIATDIIQRMPEVEMYALFDALYKVAELNEIAELFRLAFDVDEIEPEKESILFNIRYFCGN